MLKDSEKRKTLRKLVNTGVYATTGLLGTPWINNSFASCHKTWGELPSGSKNYSILEIYLDRGASQWESFWLPGTQQKPNYSDHGLSSLSQAYQKVRWLKTNNHPCKYDKPRPTSPKDSALFAQAMDNQYIHWGAPAKPIYENQDILKRCRMITQFHDVEPHEAAIPYALSGFRLGDPRRVGTGAAIQKRYCNNNSPVSFILHSISRYSADMASANGLHESAHRPIVVQLGSNNDFVTNLGRNNISQDADNLLKDFRDEFHDSLTINQKTVRSNSFDSYSAAMQQLISAKSLQNLFPNNILVIRRDNEVCVKLEDVVVNNRLSVRASLNAAAELIGKGARYTCVIDPGRAGSYDSHSGDNETRNSHLLRTSASLYHVLFELSRKIKSSSNPSGQIDLDKTMVVINTEFGRTPGINAAFGRDHWPWGYATLMIGGPIPKKKPTIAGAIDSLGYTLEKFRYSPADVRAAILLAAGVDPLADNLFDPRDFSNALGKYKSKSEIRAKLAAKILGV